VAGYNAEIVVKILGIRKNSTFAIGFMALVSASPSHAKISCAEIAAHHIDSFFDSLIKLESIPSRHENPCTGTMEKVAVESNPAEGTILFFDSGDVQANLDRFHAILCKDGRAYVRNLVKSSEICDTR
jgi:hypothetical protein